jgi:hypothetical protein
VKPRQALPALLVGSVGAGLAVLGFYHSWWPVLVGVISLALFGITGYTIGRLRLREHPISGLRLVAVGILVPAAFAVAAVVLGIFLAVQFEPNETGSVESKKLRSATVGSMSAFLTAAFLKAFDDPDKDIFAGRLQKDLDKAFRGRFEPESPGQKAVYAENWQGYFGWGLAASRARVRVIQVEIEKSL